MKKVNIANYVIYDVANRIRGTELSFLDNEIIEMVAEHWTKKHFVSGLKDIKNHHSEHQQQKFII